MTPTWVVEPLRIADLAVLTYFLLLNSGYLVLIGLAGVEVAGHRRRVPYAGLEQAYASPLTVPVSVLMPAYN